MTNDLVERAINKADLNITSEEVLKGLTVTPRADTQILEINYTSTDNVLARDVVDSITNDFIRSSIDLIQNGNVRVIESVKIPEKPVSPNKKMNIAIAFLLGIMISAGFAFLLEFMDNTFKTKEQLEQILGIPVIGTIPDDLN
jgi:capsular polysaccharide biosynthesis protein